MIHRESRLAGPKNTTLYCQSWAPEGGAKAILLLVHGLAEHSGRYQELAEYFVAAGYAVFALDHAGHGKSDGIRCHIDRFTDYTDALELFTREVLGEHPGTPAFLVGHSMGGLIGATSLLSQQSRFAGSVLSGPAVKAVEEPPRWLLFVGRILSALFPRMGQLQLDASGVSRDPDVVARYLNDPLVHTGKISARLATELFAAMENLRAAAHEIKLPILLMHGGEDSLVALEGSRILHERVGSSDKQLIVYDGLYHEIFNEPERHQVFDDMRQWLDARLAKAEVGLHET